MKKDILARPPIIALTRGYYAFLPQIWVDKLENQLEILHTKYDRHNKTLPHIKNVHPIEPNTDITSLPVNYKSSSHSKYQ